MESMDLKSKRSIIALVSTRGLPRRHHAQKKKKMVKEDMVKEGMVKEEMKKMKSTPLNPLPVSPLWVKAFTIGPSSHIIMKPQMHMLHQIHTPIMMHPHTPTMMHPHAPMPMLTLTTPNHLQIHIHPIIRSQQPLVVLQNLPPWSSHKDDWSGFFARRIHLSISPSSATLL